MEMLRLGKTDVNFLHEKLASLSAKISPCAAYDGVAYQGFARCGDGTCANTNSSDSCRKGCNGWD